jgi:Carboxypeptidase regulatory-like domain
LHRSFAFCLIVLSFLVGAPRVPAQTATGKAPAATGNLTGQVADPSGAVIPQAALTVTSAGGTSRTGTSDASGQYTISGLPPGVYTVTVQAGGFSPFTSQPVRITAGQTQHLNVALVIEMAQQQVQVTADAKGVSVDPENNVSAVVLTGKDLDALSDDPDELSNELTALAGPAAGPNGGQIFIDGFSGGQLPPKSAIRAIIINQNPFSAQYDTPGYGRIEILTKPGTDKLHGQVSLNASASAFNTSNPFAANQPPYHTLQYDGNVGGALGKKASFFFYAWRRNVQDNSIVNANVPYVPNPATCEPASGVVTPTSGTLCNLAVPYPQTRQEVSPRIDYQLTPNQTLTVRYSHYQDTRTNNGLGGSAFVLPSQAYNTNEIENRIQVSDSQVYGSKFVNNTRFQYVRDTSNQTPLVVAPAINVLQNFEGGGSPLGTVRDTQNHYEFQNYASLALAKHYIRFGGRLRNVHDTNYSNANFEGTYTYSDLNDYLAGKPSQYSVTTGTPTQSSSIIDLGLYVEDDWKAQPNLTISYGLRFETQNHIPNKFNFAPRVAVSYGIGGKEPKTVLRAGYGIFYNRFTYDLLLNTNRYNLDQQGQLQTIQSNPNGQPPDSTTEESPALPTYYRAQPGLNAPQSIETGVGLEHQVNKSVSLSATYLYSRGIHQFLSRNIDAPLPDGTRPALQLCPTGPCNIYEYDSLAVFKENQLFLNLNVAYGKKLSFTGFYIYSRANGDSSGPSYHPSNQYDITQDYGRQFFDVRNRVFAFANYTAPFGFRISPFLSAWSGAPFNIQLSQDINGDSFFNDRPVFASTSSNPANVDVTKYGNFDISATPPAGTKLVPINYGNGPILFAMNMRVAKSFGVGPRVDEGKGAVTGGGGGPGGGPQHMPGMGLGGAGGGPHGPTTRVDRKYSITLSAFAHNLFNVVNLSPPNGTLGGPPDGTTGSPFFGKSNQLASGFFSHGSAVRDFNFQALFNF